MSQTELHYDGELVDFLEALWGDGYLSPGGADEVKRLLEGIDFKGKVVLDIGCGTGGITLSLAQIFGASKVIGVDVEEPICNHARSRIVKAGFSDQVEIRQISPDKPIPIEDGSLDIVFSKDSIVHIPDKENLTQEAFRLLKPGGWFVASDWLISHDNEPSPEMVTYIKAEDLDFGMASPTRYQKALENAGFQNIELRNRNRWYFETAQKELAVLEGNGRSQFEAKIGQEFVQGQIDLWHMMIPVLETGEHCPHHFRGQKPHQ